MQSLAEICQELIDGCEDCCRQAQYVASLTPKHECDQLCSVRRRFRSEDEEFHRISHEPHRCEYCSQILSDKLGQNFTLVRRCSSGYCTQWACPKCRKTASSEGPVTCPTCGSLGRAPTIPRIRKQYARRKGTR